MLVKEQPQGRGVSPVMYTDPSPQESARDDSASSDGEGFTKVDNIRRPSLCFIQRSPESSLRRGEAHLTFSSKKKMSLTSLRPLKESLLEKLDALKPEESPSLPEVHFSLCFDDEKMKFIVHVSRAFRLPTRRLESASNPFLELYLLPSKVEVQQSLSIDGTLSPMFDTIFHFCDLPLETLRQQILVMRFYVNTGHFVGGALHSIQEADLVGKKVVREILEFDEDEGLKVRTGRNKELDNYIHSEHSFQAGSIL